MTRSNAGSKIISEPGSQVQAIFNAASDCAMLITDCNGVITAWSKGAERVFGWTAQQMCGQPFDRLFSGGHRNAERLSEQMQRALTEGSTSHERWYLCADGARVRGAGTLTPLLGVEGHFGFLKILRDCTAADEAALRLAESDKRYRTLFEAIDAGFCIIEMKFDVQGRPIDYRFLEINPAFEHQTGLADAVGKWMTDLAPAHEQHWFDIYGEVALSRRPVRFENNAEALQRWYEVQAIPIGEPFEHRVAVLFNDVSARRSAELALQALTESLRKEVAARTKDRNQLWELSSDVMIRCRFDGVIIAVNPAWQQLLGWSEAQLLGASIIDFVHPDDIPNTLETMQRSSQGQSFLHFENRYRCRNGSYRWISWSSRSADAVINAVGRDITALKEQALALEQAEAQLRQSQKMEAVGQLTGGLAHDFNNLLTAIQLQLSGLLERHPVGDPSYEGLNEIRQTAIRAADLVRKLLAFSRKSTVRRERLDLGELVGEFAILLRRLLREDVRLETDYGRDLPVVLADKSQLETAVMNLAVNARDAMRGVVEPGAGVVTISTRRLTADEARGLGWADAPTSEVALIEVSDTGPGVPPELLDKIFEPFFTTKAVNEGTGMGLATVYGIVQQAGGHISVSNLEGAGAAFRIFLPAATAEELVEAPVVEKVVKAPRDLSGAGRILFVEDEAAVRGIAARLLRQRGYEVIEAADGEEALILAEEWAGQIDMLISDVIMPGLDGPSLLRKARPFLGDAPVMFISGYAESDFS
ncbi:MAG TPA: hypothetical protein DHV63_10540, partial [Pseudomonas sp.]|nr:hypothetical protein [Pseudomonas sp.]